MTAIIDDFVALRVANVAAPSPDDLSERWRSPVRVLTRAI
jgi:hypothetical protein